MFVTLYRQSSEGCVTVEIEQQHLPDVLSDSLKVPDEYSQDINAGWRYWWEFSEMSERQVYGMSCETL